MIECVIFDCDGTLVDSELLCNLGLEIKLKEFGIREDIQSMTEKFRGWKLADIVNALAQQYSIELDAEFIKSYRKVVGELFDARLQAIPNVALALQAISLPKCVASNAPLDKIEQAVRVTNLASFFNNNFFSSYSIQSWKPQPDLFLYAAKMMGFAPENCAVIEDSLVGIEAAQRAGMKPFFYRSPGNNLPHWAIDCLFSRYDSTSRFN
jgi:HAD superfamily hydrolase (TIGR01509 family)